MVTMEHNLTGDYVYHVDVDKVISWNTLSIKLSNTMTMVTMEHNVTGDYVYHVDVDKVIPWNTLSI